MEKGTKVVELSEPTKVVIVTDGPFTVYGMDGKKKLSILGPAMETHRSCAFVLMPPLTGFMVAVKPQISWSVSYVDLTDGKEWNDLTPVEMPIGYDKPMSLEETMKLFIRDEISRVAEAKGRESFEEADDFDVGDDEMVTPYELDDMQEDAEAAEYQDPTDEPPVDPPVDAPVDPPPVTPAPADPPPAVA